MKDAMSLDKAGGVSVQISLGGNKSSSDGVHIRVVYEPATGTVLTAFPDNNPIPSYKSVN